jgi:trehalose 6-phosphate synthase
MNTGTAPGRRSPGTVAAAPFSTLDAKPATAAAASQINTASTRPQRLLIVAPRLPAALRTDATGPDDANPATPETPANPANPANDAASDADGALLSALANLLGDRRTVWIGSPFAPSVMPRPVRQSGGRLQATPSMRPATAAASGGTGPRASSPQPRPLPGHDLAGAIQAGGAALLPVALSATERAACDDGFTQRTLWPLFHGLTSLAHFELADWQAFRNVNRRFARAVTQAAARGTGDDLLWAQEPLLMGLAAELRRRRTPMRLAYFLRLPFPAADIFLRLPWRDALLAGLLAFDRLGFQSRRDLANFVDCVRTLCPAVDPGELTAGGERMLTGRIGQRQVATLAGVYPEGIDAAAVARAAAAPEIEARVQALRALHAAAAGPAAKIALAIDTLDPAQGVPEKLRAFAAALEMRPALQGQLTLVQIVSPGPLAASPAATATRRDIERLVGEINGRLGRAGWVPIQYRFQELGQADRLVQYRTADVALVTPLCAGLTPEAQEYCAADVEERGALVLSEFSGAADPLRRGAILVNPHDRGAMARALLGALRLGEVERRRRMRLLRDEVLRHDVAWWLGKVLPETSPGENTAGAVARVAV